MEDTVEVVTPEIVPADEDSNSTVAAVAYAGLALAGAVSVVKVGYNKLPWKFSIERKAKKVETAPEPVAVPVVDTPVAAE